jgi:glycosyltransferase involved in cell wall biosynthesis
LNSLVKIQSIIKNSHQMRKRLQYLKSSVYTKSNIMSKSFCLSIVVPVYNEAAGLAEFNYGLVQAAAQCTHDYQIIYCDDGSTDTTPQVVRDLHTVDRRICLLRLSRNFGKEAALSAGIAAATGDAIVMLDGDGQHPPEMIPDFVKAWREGSQVVIGVRTKGQKAGWFKRLSSRVFYILSSRMMKSGVVLDATDFRLVDRQVQQAFVPLRETSRITRGLIDWLGFERTYIPFHTKQRSHGTATYSYGKLVALAVNSFTSLTARPLYIFGYLGVFITIVAFLLGASVGVEQILLGDPWHWRFTGTALLAIALLFLVGIVLLSQGVLSVYIAYILNQSRSRPLYIVDTERSAGLAQKDHE